jgi:hypothetical protein
LLFFLLLASASAEILVEESLAQGQRAEIQVVDSISMPVAGASVHVVSRPGLSGEEEITVGITDPRGRLHWTPSEGGVYIIRAAHQERRIQVSWHRWPMSVLWSLLGLLGVTLVLPVVRRVWRKNGGSF